MTKYFTNMIMAPPQWSALLSSILSVNLLKQHLQCHHYHRRRRHRHHHRHRSSHRSLSWWSSHLIIMIKINLECPLPLGRKHTGVISCLFTVDALDEKKPYDQANDQDVDQKLDKDKDGKTSWILHDSWSQTDHQAEKDHKGAQISLNIILGLTWDNDEKRWVHTCNDW